jgi:hypothetical protein
MVEELSSYFKSKRAKKMLDFSQVIEGKTSASGQNVLNLPYTDSEDEVELIEEDIPEKESPKGTTPGVQGFEHEAPNLQIPKEEPFSSEAQDLEVSKASIRKHNKVRKSSNFENIQEEISELKFLERVIKSQNQNISNTSYEVRDCFERLAKMHVKE